MIKLRIKESLKKLDVNMFVTDYAGDIVNLIINKPEPYRIIWDMLEDVYVIGDAYEYIHRDLIQFAVQSGYIQFYNKNNSCIFIPYAQMESDWEVENRVNRTYLTTGIIVTDGDFSKLFPDLYNKLKSTQNLITKNSNTLKKLLSGYKQQLDELQNRETQLLAIFQNSDIEMKPDYEGYGDLKNYLKLREHKMDRIEDGLAALGLDDVFVLPKTIDKRIGFWKNYNKDIDGYNLRDLSQELYDNLAHQGNMYEELLRFMDDMELPYDYALDYI